MNESTKRKIAWGIGCGCAAPLGLVLLIGIVGAIVGADSESIAPRPATAETTSEPPTDIPSDEGSPTPKPLETKPQVKPKPSPAEETEEPSSDPNPEVFYSNCREVRAAGAAPIHRGEPGYSSNLDRDGDGTACDR